MLTWSGLKSMGMITYLPAASVYVRWMLRDDTESGCMNMKLMFSKSGSAIHMCKVV